MKKVLLVDEDEVVALKELVNDGLRSKNMYYEGMLGPEFSSDGRTAKEINWAMAMYNILQNLSNLEENFKQMHNLRKGDARKNIKVNVLMFRDRDR